MEQADFRKYIQRANIGRMIVPVVFLIFISLIFNYCHISSWLFPKHIDNVDMAWTAYEDNDIYITCTIDKMMYTGIEHDGKHGINGRYYYSLNNGKCRYYLIKTNEERAVPVIENYTFNARIVADDDLMKQLNEIMADQLDWTDDGLGEVTGSYIFSEVDYNRGLLRFFTGVMVVAVLMALINMAVILYNIFNPYDAVSFWRFGHHKDRANEVKRANGEYNRDIIFMSQGMYVTENYFIYHDTYEFEIVPLDDIVWAYKHSSLHWKFGTRHFITYNMRIVTKYKKTYVFGNKTKESCDALLDIISSSRPEILIGYSQENKVKMSN